MAVVHVLGSLNADLVTRIDVFPSAGETKHASSFAVHSGGKGANQAVAAGKLGADVAMFGAVADDALAGQLRASLEGAGVDLSGVETVEGVATGTASIWVDARGENAIAIAAGANGCVDAAWVAARRDRVADAEWLLLQGEIPIDAMVRLLESLPGDRPRVILDPAPVFELRGFPTGRIWLLTPNEHELRELSGADTSTDDGVRNACGVVRERYGIAQVLCKAGERGAFLLHEEGFAHVPGFAVEAVDTTAAGDTFNGALAAALADGGELREAIRFAHAAAALSVTREGAQPAMPDREAVDRFLAERGDGSISGG